MAILFSSEQSRLGLTALLLRPLRPLRPLRRPPLRRAQAALSPTKSSGESGHGKVRSSAELMQKKLHSGFRGGWIPG
jgi:hypothetical protein